MIAAKGSTGLSILLAASLSISVGACHTHDEQSGNRTDGAPVIDPAEITAAPPGAVGWCTHVDPGGAIRALVDAYNARSADSTGDLVELVELPRSSDAWYDRLAERQAAASPECDILGLDVSWTAEFAAEHWIYDLGRYLAERRAEYLPTILETVRYEGRNWVVPLAADVGLLYYRTDQVKAPPGSWQQVYAEAAHSGGGVVYQGSPGEGLTATFLEIAYANGGRVLSADGRRVMLDSTENLAALRFLSDGLTTGVAPRDVRTYTEEPARRAFEAGRATFQRNWSAAWASAQSAPAIRENVAVMALPSFANRGVGGVLGGINLGLSAHSDDAGAALRAIDWITSADGQLVAAQRGLAPTLDDLYEKALVREALPHHEALRQGINQASPPPVSPAYRELSRIISTNVSNALNGRTSPEVALAEAQHQIEHALGDI